MKLLALTKYHYLLLGLFIIGFVIRIWQVGELPVILNRDEAALAYNAKLLLETGKDEWGKSWPLALESFGDYKLPGYVWPLIILFKVFGYQEWVVRLPSVIAGALLIPAGFWFARSLKWSNDKALILAFVIATTPVFFFYSRIAFEANLALVLFVSALAALLRDHKRQIRYDGFAIGCILLAVFTYNTPLLLLPFIMVLIPFIRDIKRWRTWITPVLGLSIVLLIGGSQLLSLSERKSGITIFQDESVWAQSVEHYQRYQGVSRVLLGNKFVFWGGIIARNYFDSLSPVFLVQGKGGHPWHAMPEAGHILAISYLLSLVGLILSLHKVTKSTLIVWYLLLVSLLPAVVTVDAPHATRSLLFFFMLNVFAVIGADSLGKILAKKYFNLIFNILKLIILISFGWYLYRYFNVFPRQQVMAKLKPGFDQLIRTVDSSYSPQPVAIVDNEGFHYVLVAWYLGVPGEEFLETVVRQQSDKIGFRYGQQLKNYHFIAQESDRSSSESVLIMWDTHQEQWIVKE